MGVILHYCIYLYCDIHACTYSYLISILDDLLLPPRSFFYPSSFIFNDFASQQKKRSKENVNASTTAVAEMVMRK